MRRVVPFRAVATVAVLSGVMALAAVAWAADPVCSRAVGQYSAYSTSATCPVNQYVAGGGFMATGTKGLYFHYFGGSPSPNQYTVDGEFVEADAVCCNMSPTVYAYTGSGPYTIAGCPLGTVAVGGGGYCAAAGAVMRYSLPVADGSTGSPRGWNVYCSTGTASAYVNCVASSGPGPDVSSCHVVGTHAYSSPTAVTCPAGQIVMAAGTMCKGNGYATFGWIQPAPDQTYSECSDGGELSAFAICCNGTRSP